MLDTIKPIGIQKRIYAIWKMGNSKYNGLYLKSINLSYHKEKIKKFTTYIYLYKRSDLCSKISYLFLFCISEAKIFLFRSYVLQNFLISGEQNPNRARAMPILFFKFNVPPIRLYWKQIGLFPPPPPPKKKKAK